MKVLLITNGYPYSVMTGVGTYARDLTEALTMAGHTVSHLCTGEHSWRQSSHLRWDPRAAGQIAYVVNSPLLSPPSQTRLNQDTALPAVEALLTEALRGIRPDLIHLHDLIGIPAAFVPLARRNGFPVVITLHDFWPFCRKLFLTRPGFVPCEGPAGGLNCARYCSTTVMGFRGVLHRLDEAMPSPDLRRFLRRSVRLTQRLRGRSQSQFIVPPRQPSHEPPDPALAQAYNTRASRMREAVLTANAVLAVSRSVKSMYLQNGYPADRIHVMPLSTLASARVQWQQRRFDRYPVRFGYLGRVTPIKGAHIIAEAARGVPAELAQFTFYGPVEREDEEFLRALAGNSARLYFSGPYSHHQLDTVLEQMDLLVYASIVPETQGLVGYEAQASGLPIIGANHGAIPEYVQHEVNGLLFSPGSASALRAQILRVVHEPELISRLSARVMPPKSMDEHVRELTRVYEEALNHAGTAMTR